MTPSIEDGILSGTVRKFVVEIMENLNEEEVVKEYGEIPKKIVFGKPLFSDILSWRGVVIMSTSRLLLPINHLYIDIDDEMLVKLVGNDEHHTIFDFPKCKECGYRKIAYENDKNRLENMRLFIKDHLKCSSVFIGSVLQSDSNN